MNIAIVAYGAGNTRSVQFALERMGASVIVSSDAGMIQSADKVIVPGVGAAAPAMQSLKAAELDTVITALKQPVLGICLGMQLFCAHSEEGDVPCLGIFNQEVRKFTGGEKVPQVGWNSVSALRPPLFAGIADDAYFYFVHSYFAGIGAGTIGVTDYMGRYSAALMKDNFYGVQFHPEKSGAAGERLLQNFLEL